MDDTPAAGDLVTIAAGERRLDGIVFDVPSATKAVVAVVDRTRGPILRTLEHTVLSERTEAGPDDRALHLLIRRTPAPVHGASRGGTGGGPGRRGHTRAAVHRPTGK